MREDNVIDIDLNKDFCMTQETFGNNSKTERDIFSADLD